MMSQSASALVSIIVPIYNTEQFLPRCLDSLLNQTYKNIEVILINDGSTDDSPSICEKYVKQDNRFFLYSKENGGIASAYNLAFKVCKGEFVVFVDSDDYIEQNMISDLILEQINTNATIVQTGMIILDESGQQTRTKIPNDALYFGKTDILSSFFKKNDIFMCLACKLFKKSLFDGFVFDEGRNIVDIVSTPLLLLKADVYQICNKSKYIAFFRRQSVSRGRLTDQTYSDLLYYLKKWQQIVFDNNLLDCLPQIFYRYCYEILYKYPYLIESKNITNKKNKKREMITCFKTNYKLFKKTNIYSKVNKKHRFLFKIFNISPLFVCLLFKIKTKGK